MQIINSFFSWLFKKRMHQIDLFLKYPIEVQEETLLKLLSTAEKTEYGAKYKFAGIKNLRQFSEQVPLMDYEILKPYVIRMKHGEKDLTWPGEVKWFAKSSGTTSDKSKFIPVTRESLEECHFKGGKDMITIYCQNQENTGIFTGKSLVIGGSRQINQFNTNSYYGDLSAIIIKNLPFWADLMKTPDQEIALMENWEEKVDKIARATINDNVTNITGVPSWTMIVLKRILELSGKTHIKEVWPNLEVFFHGGVNFDPYRNQYNVLIPGPMNYLELYNASEGFFGIQNDLSKNEMLLMLDYGIYYEFIPSTEWDKENPETILLEDVSTGENYELVISTNGGLWRYRIGDTIQFTSTNPFKFIISGRTKNYINVFGEELMVHNAEKAIEIACLKTNSIVNEFTAGPVYLQSGQSGAHEWIIEFEKAPENIDVFAEILDNALKSLNSDYEAKRVGDFILKKPIIRVAPKNTFYRWMKERGKLGGQNKVPKLFNNRKYVDEINRMLQT